ncbi:MAG: hypothetical protein PHH98_05275 [Candidatus Gracilibacteria bacterium]|nr:hypothetical protein [Candidatus Gracilibacteria bacterium]
MEKYSSKEFTQFDNTINQALGKLVLITALLTTSILSGDTSLGQYRDLTFKEEVSNLKKGEKNNQTKVSGKTLSTEILEEYEKRKNSNKVEMVREETESFIKKILSKIGIISVKKVAQKTDVDISLLSMISKEYLDEHKVTIIGNDSGKAFLLTYYKKLKSSKGEIIYLPISPINPKNETLKIHKGATTFSISPSVKSNGYNTEYKISSNKGGQVLQLAILYPSEYGEYNNELGKKDTLEAKKRDLLKKENELKASEKSKKGKDGKQHKSISKQLSDISNELKDQEVKLGKMKDFKYFSYIPYTNLLDTEKNQRRGLKYLISKMKSTYDSVVTKKLSDFNSSIGGLSIGQALPQNFPLVLNIIERMDFLVYFEKDGVTLKDKKVIDEIMITQINRALTIFGVNENDAFNFQKSPVGAEGVGQVMPGTYNLYRNHEKYKSLFPEPNFSKAVKDHSTSFRLQISHFDDQIFQIPLLVRQNWSKLMEDKTTKVGLNALLAAGYNGGMKRISGEVFNGLNIGNNDLDDYKNRLTPKSIMTSMKKQRDLKISILEREINILNQKLKWNLPINQIGVIKGQIKEKQDSIISINNTYKESMTYVLKTEFVVNYLSKNFGDEFKYN